MDGDYCQVKLYRSIHANNKTYTNLSSCPTHTKTYLNLPTLSCNDTTPTACLNALAVFSADVGCCAEPFYGPGIRQCNGVSVAQPCSSATSAAANYVGLLSLVFILYYSLFM